MFNMNKAEIEARYPVGSRIRMMHMDDPYSPIPAGMTGTVRCIDDAGQIHMSWDNGRSLAIIPEVDRFTRI